jgi:peptidyl-prolyl cis-trans isomerase B (cyclophilin B)
LCVTSSRRRREVARARYERQLARREADRMRARRRQAVVAAIAAVALVIGGTFALANTLRGDEPDTSAADQPTATPSASASPGTPKSCAYTKSGRPARPVALPTFDAKAAARPYTATIRTNRGDVSLQALTADAPCAAYSFRYLAVKNFFDRTPCPRVSNTATFGILQCGDPTGTTSGGPGYRFPDENLEGAAYPAGSVAMANSGPDTNGSQFFLVFKNTQLSPNYTPFARITKGLDVLTKVGAAGDDGSNPAGGGKPKLPVTIEDVTISGAG